MADYEKMYAILCGAVDDVIDPLERIPMAKDCVEKLKAALLVHYDLTRFRSR